MNIHQYPWISPNLLNGFPLGWSKKTTPTNPMKNLIKGWSSNQETRPSHKAPRLGLFWKKVSRKSISGVHVGRWKSHFFGTKMALSRKKKMWFFFKVWEKTDVHRLHWVLLSWCSSFSSFFFKGFAYHELHTLLTLSNVRRLVMPATIGMKPKKIAAIKPDSFHRRQVYSTGPDNGAPPSTALLSQGAIAQHLTSSYFSRIHLRRNVERWHFSPTETTQKIPWRKEGTKRSKSIPTPRTYHEKKIGLNMTPPSFC